MIRHVLRSFAAAAAVAAIWGAGQLLYATVLCVPHKAWTRVTRGESAVVLDHGQNVARPGDAIFVCETPHTAGPITWHLDLDCYCAASDATPQMVAAKVGGTCAVDKLAPLRSDDWGACRHARCSHHVDF